MDGPRAAYDHTVLDALTAPALALAPPTESLQLKSQNAINKPFNAQATAADAGSW